jgi:alkaline phosphatase D
MPPSQDDRREPIYEEMPHVWPHQPVSQFADFDDHGYVIVDVTPERVRGEWWFIDAVREPTTGQHLGAAWEVRRGEPRLVRGG